MVRIALLVLGLVLALPRPAAAQEPYVVPRLQGPITLDGLSDEPAWAAVEPVPLVMQTPTFRGEPTEHTEMRIAHDDSYIYVSARCFDDPDGVRSASFKRDFFTPASDNVFVLLDTFDLEVRGFYQTASIDGFRRVKPRGRLDLSLQRSLPKGLGKLTLSLNDAFDSEVGRFTRRLPEESGYVKGKFDARQRHVQLSWSLRFGGGGESEEPTTASEEEQSRANN